jgi:hypothetical protein
MSTTPFTTRLRTPPAAVVERMAKVMTEHARTSGSCSFQDLRRGGFSRRQILAPADDARELIARTAPDLCAA